MRVVALAMSVVSLIFVGVMPARAEERQDGRPSATTANVRDFGATGDGQRDDTRAFREAISALDAGGVLYVPQGRYVVSDKLVIAKSISVRGTGVGSQIFQNGQSTLLLLQGVNAVTISHLYLGSRATTAGASLIQLNNSHHNRIVDVTMLGGDTGLYLHGSLLNTIQDLRTGVNFGGFFGAVSANKNWVVADAFNNISSNQNTFIAPVLEGGVNGFVISDNNGQGSVTISGGTVEGVSGVAMSFNNTFLPSVVSGFHFEANGVADVVLNSSSNIRLSSIMSLKNVLLKGDTRNVEVADSIVEHMTIDATTKRIRLQNITSCLQGPGGLVNNNTGVSPYDGSPNVVISQAGPAGSYCMGL